MGFIDEPLPKKKKIDNSIPKAEDEAEKTKRYVLRTKTIFGNQTFDIKPENYTSSDSAKIPSLTFTNPLEMGPNGLITARQQEFVEIDINTGNEKPLTKKEMNDIIQKKIKNKQLLAQY